VIIGLTATIYLLCARMLGVFKLKNYKTN